MVKSFHGQNMANIAAFYISVFPNIDLTMKEAKSEENTTSDSTGIR